MGQVAFSDVLNIASDEIHLWQSLIRKRQGISISSKLIRRLTKKFARRDAYRMSLPDILDAKKDAVRRYNKLKNKLTS
jgi:hypothetical protein